MATTTQKSRELLAPENPSHVWLNWNNKDGTIIVTPSNQDRFILKVEKAIEILRQGQRESQLKRQFEILLRQLASWLGDHRGCWSRAYLTAGEGVLRFVVVRKTVKHDDDVTDSLSDLDIQVANDTDLDLIKMNVVALPNASEEAISSFLDSEFTLEYQDGR